ncbi:MAG: hypothetical protein NTX91_04095 [candidate division SR1 bacterium]|nr:hypothetical protein [candidate division SR1 bacterium]
MVRGQDTAQIVFDSSPIGSLMFSANPNKMRVVYSKESLQMALDKKEITDIMLVDTYGDEQEKTELTRWIRLDDGRLVYLQNEISTTKTKLVVDYWDEQKKDPQRLIECIVDPNGKVRELTTNLNIDPNGKSGCVQENEKTNNRSLHSECNGNLIIPASDAVVIRYQTQIKELLVLLKKRDQEAK